MEITRLTDLVGADPREVERLILEIEQRSPSDRSALLGELAQALRFGDPRQAEPGGAARSPAAPRTDLADAAAVDLGFD
jgi:hypothetical protein